jgi:hypothetical protein
MKEDVEAFYSRRIDSKAPLTSAYRTGYLKHSARLPRNPTRDLSIYSAIKQGLQRGLVTMQVGLAANWSRLYSPAYARSTRPEHQLYRIRHRRE